jgi:hypothetical protein
MRDRTDSWGSLGLNRIFWHYYRMHYIAIFAKYARVSNYLLCKFGATTGMYVLQVFTRTLSTSQP